MAILKRTKKKLEQIDRQLSYFSSILFSIKYIPDEVYISEFGSYLFIRKDYLDARKQATQEQIMCLIFSDLDNLLDYINSYLDLQKAPEAAISFLDICEELEGLSYQNNFVKSYALLLDSLNRLESRYLKLHVRLNEVLTITKKLKGNYLDTQYYNTRFKLKGHKLEMFFNTDISIIRERIKYFLPDKAKIDSDFSFTQSDIDFGKELKKDIMAITQKSHLPILVLFLYYSSKAEKISLNFKNEEKWKSYFEAIECTASTAWVKYMSPMKGNDKKHLDKRVECFQKLKNLDSFKFLIKYTDLQILAEADLLEYNKPYSD